MAIKNLPDKILIAAVLLILLLSRSAYCGEFVLRKVNQHYEPEMDAGIIIPGTDIKAGPYYYVADNGNEVQRLGFLIRGKKFYFVESGYNLSGDTNYAVYKDIFLLDSWGFGSVSGHVRLMFLCKYGKDSVQLLDVISLARVAGKYGMDFMSSYKKEDIFITDPDSAWTEIKDFDNDGNPEIKLEVSTDSLYFDPDFSIYLEIKNDRLSVDFNPELYKPLFREEKKNSPGIIKTDAYYIYGFLSGELKLEDVRNTLKLDPKVTATYEGPLERYVRIMTLLENVDKWDAAFHYIYGQKFELKEYNLQRR